MHLLCVHYLSLLPPPALLAPTVPVFIHPAPPIPMAHAQPHYISALPGRCLIVTPPMGLKARRLADSERRPAYTPAYTLLKG